MAKDMQCLQAILDCMKKEKAEYPNMIDLYHRISAVFGDVKAHLLIKTIRPFMTAHAQCHSGLLNCKLKFLYSFFENQPSMIIIILCSRKASHSLWMGDHCRSNGCDIPPSPFLYNLE